MPDLDNKNFTTFYVFVFFGGCEDISEILVKIKVLIDNVLINEYFERRWYLEDYTLR